MFTIPAHLCRNGMWVGNNDEKPLTLFSVRFSLIKTSRRVLFRLKFMYAERIYFPRLRFRIKIGDIRTLSDGKGTARGGYLLNFLFRDNIERKAIQTVIFL